MNDTISKFQPTPFNNQDNNNNETQKDNQPSIDYQSIVDALIKRNETQNANIIGQREIINNSYNENKELKETIKTLQNELNELKHSLTQNSSQNGSNERILGEIETLRKRVDGYEEEKRRQEITPLLEMLRDYGVDKDNVEQTFNQVKQIYGVNLLTNPNKNLLEIFLTTQGYSLKQEDKVVESSNNIVGGYSQTNYNTNQNNSTEEQVFLMKKQKKLEEYSNYLEQQIAKRKQNY